MLEVCDRRRSSADAGCHTFLNVNFVRHLPGMTVDPFLNVTRLWWGTDHDGHNVVLVKRIQLGKEDVHVDWRDLILFLRTLFKQKCVFNSFLHLLQLLLRLLSW